MFTHITFMNIDENNCYVYKIVDTNFSKVLKFINMNVGMEALKIHITNELIKGLYFTYKYNVGCPFVAIKKFCDSGETFESNIIRQTSFYKEHYKVMDKFLPAPPAPKYTFGSSTTSSSSIIYYASNTNDRAYNFPFPRIF